MDTPANANKCQRMLPTRESKQAMEKRQLIDAIRELNPTATEAFLQQFADADLDRYLVRLKDASARSIRIVGWSSRQPNLRKVS